MKTITYQDKAALYANNDIPNQNKVTDSDMNEIKDVVNSNASANQTIYANDFQCKNLFNKYNPFLINNATINSSTKLIETNSQYKMLYIPCLPNTTYTISKVQSGYLTAGYTDTKPALGVYVNGYVASSDTTKCTITTNSTANYIVLRYYRTTDTLTDVQIRDTVQIEVGSEATTYTPFKSFDKTIYSTLPVPIGIGKMGNDIKRFVVDTHSVTIDGAAHVLTTVNDMTVGFVENAYLLNTEWTKTIPMNMTDFDGNKSRVWVDNKKVYYQITNGAYSDMDYMVVIIDYV